MLMNINSLAVVILFLGSIVVLIQPELAISEPISYRFFKDCAAKIGLCWYEIYLGVFRIEHVTDKCCTQFVPNGKECRKDLVAHLITQPGFKGSVFEVLANSEQVWNDCISISPSLS